MLRLPRKMQRIFGKTSQKYCACHAKRLVTHHETCWNVAKCYAATQNDITACFETFNQGRFCSFPHRHGNATGKPETRDETCWSIKTSISCETSLHFTIRSVKIDVFPRVFLRTDIKIDVSYEASVDFHHMSRNSTPATEFAPCHHFAQS